MADQKSRGGKKHASEKQPGKEHQPAHGGKLQATQTTSRQDAARGAAGR